MKILLIFILTVLAYNIYTNIRTPIRRKINTLGMKEVYKNPKWLMSELKSYYGFDDVNIIFYKCKNNKADVHVFVYDALFEIWLDDDVFTTKDIDKIGRIVLFGKLKTLYHTNIADNLSLQLLSILCFILDGGHVTMSDANLDASVKETKE